jgi:hypothetical protein
VTWHERKGGEGRERDKEVSEIPFVQPKLRPWDDQEREEQTHHGEEGKEG